jgi:hypothetical protein
MSGDRQVCFGGNPALRLRGAIRRPSGWSVVIGSCDGSERAQKDRCGSKKIVTEADPSRGNKREGEMMHKNKITRRYV